MSVKAMALVWETKLETQTKLILLAYADHADHDGNNIFPSIGLVSWKTGSSPNTIRRHTKKMIEMGILISVGESKLGTNQYKIDFDKLPKLKPYIGTGRRGRPETNPPIVEGLELNPPKSETNPPAAMEPEPSLEPSLKTPPPEKTPKPKSEYVIHMEHLEKVFADNRPCPPPDWEGNGAGLNKTWRQPLNRILKRCRGDLSTAEFFIRKAIKQMKKDSLTFSMPCQIEKTAESLIDDYFDQNQAPEERNLTEERLARA